jgi:hypothetical protein
MIENITKISKNFSFYDTITTVYLLLIQCLEPKKVKKKIK